ncbi:hypothetical protein [Amycolatopsis cihanbeyliensis]|uniref:Uncharacterized protein n=1 Tax=Amycolatopsis cihanbeyliensis TaxID=1128664 RepID=A0A542DNM5_AMYCI|nr:hypothetical protein [Amycolatopsis cihanbeyliensis]TQJ04698.1 hypothetical protein FB471_4505 [Amycolatopsis cihanbeyliensis]
MSDATWYLGPVGDLRPLTCPEPQIETTEVRYGGTHQGLSGARTMDVTGHAHEFTFTWTYLEQAEWQWLKALHTRHIPGPVRLINPMLHNRLSTRATTLRIGTGMDTGVRHSGGILSRVADWPSWAGPGYESAEWTGWGSAFQYIRFDERYKTPVFAEETLTGSIYARSDTTQRVHILFDVFDRQLQRVGSTPYYEFEATPEWGRHWFTRTVPPGCAAVQLALLPAEDYQVPLRLAAPQIAATDEITDWDLGGAATTVHLDQLSTSSPRFPLTDCSMTLLEA